MFPVYGEKCLSKKAVYKWVDKFSQGRSKVADEDWPCRPVQIVIEPTVRQVEEMIQADRRITIDSIATAIRCSHGLAYSIMHDRLNFQKVCSGGCPDNWLRNTKWIEWACACNVSLGTPMKEKTCLTGLLLGMNHGCITTNPNQSVIQCNGNILLHLHAWNSRLRPQLVRLCLQCFGILKECC